MTLPPTSLSQLIQQTDSVASPSQARLQALYTFTSNQELTNPAGFENNVKWWSNVIQESLRSGLMGRGAGTSTIDKSSGDQEEEALLVYLGDRLGFEGDRESLGRVFEWTDGGLTGTGRPKGLACVIVSTSSLLTNVLALTHTFALIFSISRTRTYPLILLVTFRSRRSSRLLILSINPHQSHPDTSPLLSGGDFLNSTLSVARSLQRSTRKSFGNA
jgi:hypothetical protein